MRPGLGVASRLPVSIHVSILYHLLLIFSLESQVILCLNIDRSHRNRSSFNTRRGKGSDATKSYLDGGRPRRALPLSVVSCASNTN